MRKAGILHMLPASKTMKQAAKGLLHSKWPQLIAITFIFCSGYVILILVQQLLQDILGVSLPLAGMLAGQRLSAPSPSLLLCEIVSLILLFILWSPLQLGVQRWFWRLSGGADDTVGGVFHYFSTGRLYARALLFRLLYSLRLLLIGLAAFLPAGVAYILTSPDFYAAMGVRAPVTITSLWSLPGALFLLGLIAFIAWSLRYFLAPYLLINDPDLSPRQALRLSVKASRGSRGAFFGFQLSFVGWLLLCLLALPILFVFPYMAAAKAVFMRYAIHGYNARLQRTPAYGMY